ncbi:T9SS type A sorting domain-containing protein [Flavobacterium dankookense]|uniref:Putative secreted protein (Por secretion system target) n=1 Tax=Flavobacterium dankookense TaxID=706186 RepID=A0A4R6Q9K0_9FLAO|nr:T9SS type A sorting domain-containing protein [Flavobacterium dankookense]TDP59304.1 putative secreted protein (Por secretion system target) [Flavobacterium dankookense]
MKQTLLFFLMISLSGKAQSVVQSVNSGSIITTNSSISIGEIVIIPENQNQSVSGIIGILTQVNDQTLEVPQLELTNTIRVFPNPTTNSISFQTATDLTNEKISIYNLSGQLVSKKQVSGGNALDLSDVAKGVYLIQFDNKKINSFKIIKR